MPYGMLTVGERVSATRFATGISTSYLMPYGMLTVGERVSAPRSATGISTSCLMPYGMLTVGERVRATRVAHAAWARRFGRHASRRIFRRGIPCHAAC